MTKKKKTRAKPNVAARLDPDVYDRVEKRAEKQERSMSAMINILLREALKKRAGRRKA